jgi:trimeric autotransporter adhesin
MVRAAVSRVVRVASRLLPPLAAALLGCSDGSDGSTSPSGTTAPVIAELSVWPDVLSLDQGGGMASVPYSVHVSDPDADVARIVATVLDASQVKVSQSTLPVENPPGATMGALAGEAAVPTTTIATYTIEIQAFDRDGRGSNVLRRSLSVVAGNPVPTIAALSPESVDAGGPSFVLTVTGTGFVPGSTVQWNGSTLSTTYVDETTLRAQVDFYLGYFSGSVQITVYNPAPGGGTSAAATFVVEPPPPNPVPALTSISPESVDAGGPSFVLTVTGTGFVPGSTVHWNGSTLSTTYVDETTLRAQVDSYLVYFSGSVQITVYNPAPAGGMSAAATFVVEPPPPNPVPTLTSISPTSVDAGGPSFTLTVTGSGFVAYSRILWNGNYVSTTFVDSTTLTGRIESWDVSSPRSATITVSNPTPAGGTSTPLTFTVTRPEVPGLTVVSLKGNDLAWDPYQQKIYVSVPSISPVNPNTVTVLDPFTGELTGSQYVGSEPDRLALSDDGQLLYVALRGASSVERLTLPDLSQDLSMAMGRDPTYGPYYASDLRVAPGSPRTLAVSLATQGSSSSGGGIVIYDDATPRPTQIGGGTGSWYRYDSLQWGTTASDLYASNASYAYDLYTFSVDGSGIVLRNTYRNAFSSYGIGMRFDAGTGLLYAEDGRAVDPETGLLAGTFPVSGGYYTRRMVPDSTLGSAFFVSGDSYSGVHATLNAYDLMHYYPTRSMTLSFAGAPPRRLIRWGVDGLAYLTPECVVLFRGPFVLPVSPTSNPVPTLGTVSPSSATAGSPNLVLAVTGTDFVRGSTVLWNGSERATTFVSPTSLLAYVPASDLAAAGAAEITVASPSPGGGLSGAATFTVSP